MIKNSIRIFVLFTTIIFLLKVVSAQDFESASSVDRTREQIEKLPKDDIWWSVNGEDMAWNNKNLHRMFPTVNVYREGPVSRLEYALSSDEARAIANYPVQTPAGKKSYEAFLTSNDSTTMGIVILYQGKIVFEKYPRMQAYEKSIYWSVTKVFVATVLAILEDRGLVDVAQPIDEYLPKLAQSDFAGVTIRNILDMASGVNCNDDYDNRDACYYRFAASIGDAYWDENSDDNPYVFFENLKTDGTLPQGTRFGYSGANTFVLGWLIEEITGMPFQDALSKEIWRHIGAESDASILAPRFGVPVTDGGLLARLRDVARFGLLFTPSRKIVSDHQIISDRYLNLIINGGNPQLLKNVSDSSSSNSDVKHNVYQWDAVFSNNDIYKAGWAGQGLLINPDRDLVAVYVGYFKKDKSEVPPMGILRTVLNGVFGPKSK